MERKVVFFASLGAGAGPGSAEGFIFPAGTSNEDLDAEAWDFGVAFAESYGVYMSDEDDRGEGLHRYYLDNVEGYWEEYNAEKHDGQITYGNEEPRWNKR